MKKVSSGLGKSFEILKKVSLVMTIPVALMLGGCGEDAGYEEEDYEETEIYEPTTRGLEEDTSGVQNDGMMEGEDQVRTDPEMHNESEETEREAPEEM